MGRLCDWSTYVHVSTSGLSQAVSFIPWQPKAKDSVARSLSPRRRAQEPGTHRTLPLRHGVWALFQAVAPLLALGVDVPSFLTPLP